MIATGDSDLTNLVQELVQLLNQQPTITNTKSIINNQKLTITNTEYQAPIKGAFYNSGNFSPGVATDPRHQKGHNGVDLRTSMGTSVYPLTSGIVTHIGSDSVGGNTINIQHANGVRSYYAHLSSIKVQQGDKVDKNTVIGTVGNSGNAKGTWPHLHFQVWKNGQLQNPSNLFSIPPYTAVDKTKEKWWNPEASKNEISSFNIKKHIESKKAALTQNINKLYKISNIYLELCKI